MRGSLTATMAVTYDAAGNLLTLDGPLAGTADTIRYRYDAGKRLVGIVGPAPDGAGTRKPAAQRITLNAYGAVTKVERGTVNSQSDADWSAFSPAESVVSTYDVNARKGSDILSSGGTNYAARHYSYDALGRLDCAALRLNAAIYANLPASACALGIEGSFGPDRITKYQYDAAGWRFGDQHSIAHCGPRATSCEAEWMRRNIRITS